MTRLAFLGTPSTAVPALEALVADGHAIELVVSDQTYKSSHALLLSERDRLRGHGWTGVSPDTGDQLADESPGRKLRVTYATADGDLKGIDLGWIRRTRSITLASFDADFHRFAGLELEYLN